MSRTIKVRTPAPKRITIRVPDGRRKSRGFTLLEVMIALGVLGIALLALLALHHRNLQSVIRGQQLSCAALLAQSLMSQVEIERFPDLGATKGDFGRLYPRMYPSYRWQRTVEASQIFPDIRKVEITIFYGPRFRRTFTVVEYVRNPAPMPNPLAGQAAPPQLPGAGALGMGQ